VNILLVIHPRKEQDGFELGLSSIGGTAKASQEADIVLILQHLYDKTSLDIRKNRYDGKLGRIPLQFNDKRLIFEEIGVLGIKDDENQSYWGTGSSGATGGKSSASSSRAGPSVVSSAVKLKKDLAASSRGRKTVSDS
jgi:twinkle protein